MAINSKDKGNTYERKISNTLSERFEKTTGIKKSFIRNPGSGAYFGGQFNKRKVADYDTSKTTFGDIIVPENFNYSIECKHYKTAPLLSAISKQKVKDWDTWYKQAKQDAEHANKKVLIIIKYNNVDAIVLLEEKLPDIEPFIIYKNLFCYSFEDFLSFEDDFYFQNSLDYITETKE